jgi:hypothetical protein
VPSTSFRLRQGCAAALHERDVDQPPSKLGRAIEDEEGRVMLSARKIMVAGAVAALFTTAEAQQGACKQDTEKFCKDVQPGEGKMVQCLKSHQSELSAPCQGRLKQVGQQMKQLSDACEPDVEKYCWDTPVGKGGIAKCLKQHTSDLSTDCKGAINKMKAAKK